MLSLRDGRKWFSRKGATAPAVMFHGFVFEPTGYGKASRAYIHALHGAGVSLSVVNLGGRVVIPDPLVQSLLNRRLTPNLHLCHVDPTMLNEFSNSGCGVVAVTTWEADRLPPTWIEALRQVVEVWVPSRHDYDVFTRSLNNSVFRLPHPALPSRHTPDVASVVEECGLTKGDFVFYSIFTWQDRKCPLGLIEAFVNAFSDRSDVVLIIKTMFSMVSGEEVLRAAPERTRPYHSRKEPRVIVVPAFWPEKRIQGLARRGNCYVSLHRGEGWCYPLFDAACAGTPVIATNYSGPTDYLDPTYHALVDYRLVPVAQKFAHFSSEMLWAEPDLEQASFLMRHVYENREEVRRLAATGADILRRRYSLSTVGRTAADRLNVLTHKP